MLPDATADGNRIAGLLPKFIKNGKLTVCEVALTVVVPVPNRMLVLPCRVQLAVPAFNKVVEPANVMLGVNGAGLILLLTTVNKELGSFEGIFKEPEASTMTLPPDS